MNQEILLFLTNSSNHRAEELDSGNTKVYDKEMPHGSYHVLYQPRFNNYAVMIKGEKMVELKSLNEAFDVMKSMRKIASPEFCIHENSGDNTHLLKKIDIKVSADKYGVYIEPEGHEDHFGGAPIMIGLNEGRLELVAWSDRQCEDAQDYIDMSGAITPEFRDKLALEQRKLLEPEQEEFDSPRM